MSSSSVLSPRKPGRLAVVLPVKVSTASEPTQVRAACTFEISANGAKLMKLEGISEGDVLWIARNTRRAKFKVVWIGQAGSDLDGKIGIESLEPDKFIWDDDLRAKLA
jgi:hypothetical protein